MADPWFKFFPTDWRADPALRMCSAAARGVWIDMICLMHDATPYGHLLVNGHCPTDAQVAVLTGTPPEEFSQHLRELEEAGVFSRTRNGVIYSRKMTRMAKRAATARNNGRKGGNPNLGKQTENPPLDNPKVKGRDKPQNQKPEPEVKKEDTNVSSKKTASRKTRIREDSQITEKMIEFATGDTRGHSLQEAEAQFQKFKNNALAKGLTYVDWDRAFLTWLDSPYFKTITNGGSQHGQSRNIDGSGAAMAQRAGERFAARYVDSGPGPDTVVSLLPTRQSR